MTYDNALSSKEGMPRLCVHSISTFVEHAGRLQVNIWKFQLEITQWCLTMTKAAYHTEFFFWIASFRRYSYSKLMFRGNVWACRPVIGCTCEDIGFLFCIPSVKKTLNRATATSTPMRCPARQWWFSFQLVPKLRGILLKRANCMWFCIRFISFNIAEEW